MTCSYTMYRWMMLPLVAVMILGIVSAVVHRGHTENTAVLARQLDASRGSSGPHVDPEVPSAPSSHDDLTMWL